MRTLLVVIIFAMLGVRAHADTTNRALQVSPVPGMFVGGVGLLCEAADASLDSRQYFLLTKSRARFGLADFSRDDDVNYSLFEVEKSPDIYRMANEALEISVNRKTLAATMDGMGAKTNFTCEAMSITNLHNAAKLELQKLLRGNRI